MEKPNLETPKHIFFNNLIKKHFNMRDDSKEYIITYPRCSFKCNVKGTNPREVRTLKKIALSEVHQAMKYTTYINQETRLDNFFITQHCWKTLNIPETLKKELKESYMNCIKHKNSVVIRQSIHDVSTEVYIVKDSLTYRRLKNDKILRQTELEKYFLRFQLWSKIRYRYSRTMLQNELIPQLRKDLRARRNQQ